MNGSKEAAGGGAVGSGSSDLGDVYIYAQPIKLSK